MRLDHILHLFAGAAIAALGALTAVLMGLPAGPWWSVLAALTAGLAKEVWDSLGSGTVEASDVFWTVAGSVSVIATFAALD